MKKEIKTKNSIMTFELNKPTKWYQWLAISLIMVGIVYLLIKKVVF